MTQAPVVIVGAGAAGLAAGLVLRARKVPFLIVEARDRIGGRAHTVVRNGLPLDLGCGWLHHAEANSWRDRFQALGLDLDATPGPWMAPAIAVNFPPEDQADYRRAFSALDARLTAAAHDPDRTASDLLEPGSRWNPLLNAFSAAYNGASFDRISVHDYSAYEGGETNWRVPTGYGAAIAYAARDLPARLSAPVRRIEHGGRAARVALDGETLDASAVVVTIPTAHLAAGEIDFDPPLTDKRAAAAALPLGCAAKVFLELEGANADFAPESLLHGQPYGPRPASFHIRPFGRPVIETYVGGDLAAELERAGEAAFADFAIGEIVDALGSALRPRLSPLAATAWSVDPWARDAYSYARVGHHDARAALARPVNERLFFAGEAAHLTMFSTAHGAHDTGVAAAEAVIAALS